MSNRTEKIYMELAIKFAKVPVLFDEHGKLEFFFSTRLENKKHMTNNHTMLMLGKSSTHKEATAISFGGEEIFKETV